jgi:phage baseplate assembly protein W
MAFGFSPVIPIQRDDTDGFYVLTKTIAQNVRQNLRNLMLTNPGERVMVPNFGAGLRQFLFENNTFEIQSNISDRIESQIETYMPFVKIERIDFSEVQDSLEPNYGNLLSIRIFYGVPSKGLSDMLTVSKENVA